MAMRKRYDTEIQVLLCDITQLQVEAIVNSANASLLPGSGLCGAIFKAAGKALEEECQQYGRLAEGKAIAVSYTHLDVYKRQELYWTKNTAKAKSFWRRLQPTAHTKPPGCVSKTIVAAT